MVEFEGNNILYNSTIPGPSLGLCPKLTEMYLLLILGLGLGLGLGFGGRIGFGLELAFGLEFGRELWC